jgi:hypothetical protein
VYDGSIKVVICINTTRNILELFLDQIGYFNKSRYEGDAIGNHIKAIVYFF